MEITSQKKIRLLLILLLVSFASLTCAEVNAEEVKCASVKLKPSINELKTLISTDPVVRRTE